MSPRWGKATFALWEGLLLPLPYFFLQGKPLLGNRHVPAGIGQSTSFELLSQIDSPAAGNVLNDGVGNQAATVTFRGNAVQHPHGFLRQDDIDSYGHGGL